MDVDSQATSLEGGRKVSFAPDTKSESGDAASKVEAGTSKEETQVLDGVIGQLEIYESGTVKMRLANGILLEVWFPQTLCIDMLMDMFTQVTAATQPSFLQHAAHLDVKNKRLSVMGEVNKRFVVSPDVDALLSAMEDADRAKKLPVGDGTDGLITMDDV